jgi:hypothetical protein
MDINVGDYVTVKGWYKPDWIIHSVFYDSMGKMRYVGEATDVPGLLHIFSEDTPFKKMKASKSQELVGMKLDIHKFC